MEKESTMPQKSRVTRRKVVASGPVAVTPEIRKKMIEDAAYYRYQKRGNGGDHVEDWLIAEAEIEAMLNGKS